MGPVFARALGRDGTTDNLKGRRDPESMSDHTALESSVYSTVIANHFTRDTIHNQSLKRNSKNRELLDLRNNSMTKKYDVIMACVAM